MRGTLPQMNWGASVGICFGPGEHTFAAWGPDCERVHDAMDAEIVGENPPTTYIGCVMTTWHAEDTLREAFDYFLDCTTPNEDFAPGGCASALTVVVRATDWAEDIEHLAKSAAVPIAR